MHQRKPLHRDVPAICSATARTCRVLLSARMISNAASKTAQRTLRSSLACRTKVIVAAVPFDRRRTPYSSNSGPMSTESPTDVRTDDSRQPSKAAAFEGAAVAPSPAGASNRTTLQKVPPAATAELCVAGFISL